ncbi:MAG: hypothetical protein ACN6OM_18290 [Alcaligenes nematophilus]|uniref:hypothetical protein n=1 Tax=Alcaligenes nematophilus TaxID=2994643 RepID=UPI000ABA2A8B|nr:hypothetical protein [Alcaligenes faecalis]
MTIFENRHLQVIYIFFFGIIFLPGLLISSLPFIETNFIGIILTCSITLFIYLIFNNFSFLINLNFIFFLTLFNLIIFSHLILTHLLFIPTGSPGDWKSLFSVLSLSLIIFSCYLVSKSINILSEEKFNGIIDNIFYFLLIIGVFSSFFIFYYDQEDKNMLFFTEPSHYALIILIFYCYKSLTKKINSLWVFPIILIGLIIQNITLIAGSILTFLFFLLINKRTFLFFIPASIFLLGCFLFFIPDSNNYFASRLQISLDSDNTSVLTLLSGYEQALISLKETWGLGYGFQRMGYVNPRGDIINTIASYRLGETSSNLYDGGTFFSKIVVEFGIIGIFIALLISCFAIYSFNLQDKKLTFFFSIFLISFIYFFLRGSGYFTSYPVLLILSLCFIFSHQNRGNTNVSN